MTSTVIVTSADANYFELLKGLVVSIRRTQPQPIDVVVLDCGLNESHRSWLAEMDVRTVVPGWDIPVTWMDEWYKAIVVRPHVPKWVPGYDVYLWIDPDAWIQDWQAIEMILHAADKHGVAAVPSVDRAYPVTTGVRPEKHTMLETTMDYFLREELFGEAVAQRLTPFPSINGGVLATRSDSPLWNHWSRRLRSAIEILERANSRATGARKETQITPTKGDGDLRPIWGGAETNLLTYLAEQAALNVALYEDVRSFARLPAWCNWLCYKAYPKITKRGEFLEPEYPNRRLGIIHMAAETKEGTFELLVEGGGVRTISLRCPWVDEPASQTPAHQCTS